MYKYSDSVYWIAQQNVLSTLNNNYVMGGHRLTSILLWHQLFCVLTCTVYDGQQKAQTGIRVAGQNVPRLPGDEREGAIRVEED